MYEWMDRRRSTTNGRSLYRRSRETRRLEEGRVIPPPQLGSGVLSEGLWVGRAEGGLFINGASSNLDGHALPLLLLLSVCLSVCLGLGSTSRVNSVPIS